MQQRALIAAGVCLVAALGVPADARVGRAAAPGEVLLYTHDAELRRLPLSGDGGERTVAAIGAFAALSGDGTLAASRDGTGITVVDTRSGATALTLPGGTSAAFTNRGSLVFTRQPGGRSDDDHDCSSVMTTVEEVRLDVPVPVSRLIALAPSRLVVAAAAQGIAYVNVPTPDCTDLEVERLDLATGERTPVAGVAHLMSLDAGTGVGWFFQARSPQHPRGRGVLLDARGRTVASTPYNGEATFGPKSLLAYTHRIYKRDPYLASDVVLGVGRNAPSRHDRQVRMHNEGDLAWSTTGSGFALRRAVGDGLQAFYCAVPQLRCRALPLRWHDEVDLLGIVPAA